ncbi:hypothetical protein [Hymenobacter sp. DG25B]|uniref:hypothetical protein n=1 Tax=Hymenobacter sp. DG25B TaxID=1385664 RepID=UPI000662A00A|nr:hypothetical protein [Hymenobacter sp. DG25B]
MRKLWLAGAVSLLLAACNPDAGAPKPVIRSRYFNLKGFLDAQADLLNQQRPAVEKRVQLRNGQLETTRVPQVDWTKELQIFYQADITKPALRGAYTIDSVVADGLLRRTYSRREGIENPVRTLTVVTEGPQVREVQAVITQDNPLFYSEKQFTLHAQQNKLADYQVRGVQKLVLFDTLRYSASSRLLP